MMSMFSWDPGPFRYAPGVRYAKAEDKISRYIRTGVG